MIKRNRIGLLAVVAILAFGGASAAVAQEMSQYAGQEKREIKSLSADDIEQLKAGKGWGLAKAAELNGYPGPSHLLEMKDKIGLSGTQLKQVQGIFEEMRSAAVPLGNRLIELERELDKEFSGGTVDRAKLEGLLSEIGKVQGELRFVHLSAHLKTPLILTKEQIRTYNSLRGYGSDDPCRNVPEGHDAEAWKKHNGCGP